MNRREFLRGTIEMVVLSMLKEEDMYGYQIMQKLKGAASDVLAIKEGTLYPLLLRLQNEGWIAGKWVKAGEKRRRHVYTITKKGLAQLKDSRSLWNEMNKTVNSFMHSGA